VLAFGLLLYALGRSQDVTIFAVASQIPILTGVVLLTLGAAALRVLWFPLLFLVFMIPLPGFLVDAVTGPLKLQVSIVAEHLLYAVDYPVGRSGVSLTVGPYELLVADACSGLHSMFSLMAVGLLYSQLVPRDRWLRTGILVASILPVAFAANVARVIVLSLVTYHLGAKAGQGFIHDLASPLLFAVALLLIVALDTMLGWVLPDRPRGAQRPGAAADRSGETAARARPRFGNIPVGVALLLAVPLTMALTPRAKVGGAGPEVDLESMIPTRFGEWRIDPTALPLVADPETNALLDKLYSQILARTYRNARGQAVMLVIAYGGDQRRSLEIHKPEVCYPAQGFEVVSRAEAQMDTGIGTIPARRLTAVKGPRVEPVTYWMTIGERVAQTRSAAWKLELIRYGLTGSIPDGLLIRVSSISSDEAGAYRAQEAFVKALVGALPAQHRTRLIGTPADPPEAVARVSP
jgi:exosortase B